MPRARILGAVMAGGRSRRFGGDKALAVHAGRPLIEHAIAAVAAQVDHVVVCGRRYPGIDALDDRPEPGLGPLGALNAALHFGAARRFDHVLTTGCDIPWLPEGLVAGLLPDAPAVLADSRLVGLWPTALAGQLDRYLATERDRSIRAWMAVSGAREVMPEVHVPNINTPDDLHRLDLRSDAPNVRQHGDAGGSVQMIISFHRP